MQTKHIRQILNNYDLATRGAIMSVLFLLRDKDGRALNEDVVIAKMINLQIRTWRKMKATLIQDKIIYVDGDYIKSDMCDMNVLTNESNGTKFDTNFIPNFTSIIGGFEVSPKVYPKHCSALQGINNETNIENADDVTEDQVNIGVAADCRNGRMSTEVNVMDEESDLSVKERKNHYKKKEKNPPKGGFYSAHTYTREATLREPVALHIEVRPWLDQQHCSTCLMEIEVEDLKVEEEKFVDHFGAQGWRTSSGAKITDRVSKFKSWIRNAAMHKKTQHLRTGTQMKNYKPVTNYDELILEIENGEK